jgi:hypothetical protein
MRALALAITGLALIAIPAHAADPVLVAAGDAACAPGDVDYNGGAGTVPPAATPGRCHQGYTADLIEGIAPAHLLALGDLQYEDGALTKFNLSYEASWGRPAIKVKTKPVPGNHEYGAGNTTGGNIHHDDDATGYFSYFQPQLAAEGPDAGNPRKGWYSYDVPVGGTKWHIVALNSECAAGLRFDVEWDGDCDYGSEQEQWLRTDLAADTSDCTIAYWHHPRFSSGDLGDNAIMAPIWEALYEDYADIVLAGHDHNYERFAPKSGTGAVAPGRGIREWVVGTGGKDLLALRPPRAGSEVRSNSAHGVLKLTLHGPSSAHPFGWYEWLFVNDGMSGSAFTDTGSGDCVGPPRPIAAKPAARVVVDRLAPRLSLVRLSRKRFRVGRGTVIGFTLSEAATATLRIDRKRRGRYRRAGSFKRKLLKGRARVRFSGRLGRRKLKPGVYRLTITPKDAAGNAGRPRRLFFRIL